MANRTRRAAASPRSTASVSRVATELIHVKRTEHHGATVFLGAGASIASGILSWPDLCRAILDEFHIRCAQGEDPVAVLVDHFASESGTERERYLALYSKLGTATPSRGYYHLAQLAAVGYVSTILTTNWDSLYDETYDVQRLWDRYERERRVDPG